VRKFSDEEAQTHIDEAFKIWEERSANDWELDVSLITNNGFKLSKTVEKNLRSKISNERLGI
jgi:hypothetical protein